MPEGGKPWWQRNRYWILWVVVVAVVIATALIAGKGSGKGSAQRPRIGFGANVKPLASAALNYVNGWVAADTGDSVGVYAGSQKAASRNGMFVIVRVSGGTREHARTLVTKGTGSLTLLRPAAPGSEAAAGTATLHFVTANGSTGTLDLSNDTVSVNR